MPRSVRRRDFGVLRVPMLAGWLFADLFLVLFIVAFASQPAAPLTKPKTPKPTHSPTPVVTHSVSPSTSPSPSPKPTQVGLEQNPQNITVQVSPVDVDNPATRTAALASLLANLHTQLASRHLLGGAAGFVVIFATSVTDNPDPVDEASKVANSVLGGTHYGTAFQMLFDAIEDDVRKLKANGDQVYWPAVFFLSDGRPNDKNWRRTYERVTDVSWPLRPNILAFGFGKADPAILRRVATVQAFIAEPGMGPAAALREFAGSLIRSIVNSASRPAVSGALVLAVPDNVPGFTTLPADPI